MKKKLACRIKLRHEHKSSNRVRFHQKMVFVILTLGPIVKLKLRKITNKEVRRSVIGKKDKVDCDPTFNIVAVTSDSQKNVGGKNLHERVQNEFLDKEQK